jgi:Fe-S cluster biogenesis protein NfuA/nitrite reductase/ring-hydroxylating ferredoxin subunit
VDDSRARERVGRVEALLEELEALPDPAARERAVEVVEALLDLYGEGLSRIVERIAACDDGELAQALSGDELVSHLLLLHDLHPVPLEQRVRGALDEVRPYLESHGGDVELLEIADGVARLRLEGSCSGCPSSTMTLKLAIEDAIQKAAPDLRAIEAEGAARPPAPAQGLLQLEVSEALHDRPAGATDGDPRWATAGGMAELPGGGSVVRRVSGEDVLFLRLNGTLYAYRPACPECGASLDRAALEAAELTCAACARRYDVRGAGRCLDAPGLHLDPVPLLVDDAGLVKVALGTAVA